MEITAIYDFESAMEAAFSAWLEEQEVAVYIPPFDDANPSRTRVECTFETGGAAGGEHIVSSQRRTASYVGTLTLHVVTESGTEGFSAHRAYRAMVRNVLANARPVGVLGINGTDADGDAYLTHHKVQDIVETGCTPNYKSEEGYHVSTLVYQVKFGVDHAAWAALS